MSDAKRAVLHELGPRWLISSELVTSIDGLAAAFGREAPCVVDLGGGTGEATRAWALDHPNHDVVAIEVHRPGIVRLVQDLESDGPPNVRIIEADGTVVLDAWGARRLTGVRALFPDPWPKRRHVGRRLVDVGFVRRATDLLLPGGSIHLATDWDDYADQMRTALVAEPRLQVQVDRTACHGDADLVHRPPGGASRDCISSQWRSARPPRPVTGYERRGQDAGRTITDLVAHRR